MINDYYQMMDYLRDTPYQSMAINENLKPLNSILSLSDSVSDFNLSKSKFNSLNWVLTFRIKLDVRYSDVVSLVGTLDDLNIKTQFFLSWTKTDRGIRAMSTYLPD